MSHIQKTAPGPPVATAVAMPAMLPVPTREAVDTMRAWKDEMDFSPWHVLFLRQLGEHVLDVANLHRLGADGVVDAHEHQQDHQDVGVHKGVDLTSPSDEHLVQIGHRCFLSESAPGPATWIAFQTGSPFCGRIQ